MGKVEPKHSCKNCGMATPIGELFVMPNGMGLYCFPCVCVADPAAAVMRTIWRRP